MSASPIDFSVMSRLTFDLLHRGTSHQTTGLAFSPDGRWLAGSCEGSVRVWSIPGGELVTVFAAGGGGLAWMPQGQLAVGTGGRQHNAEHAVQVLSVPDGNVQRRLPNQPRPIRNVAASLDGLWIASADDQTVHLWSIGGEATCTTFPTHHRVFHRFVFSPDGTLLVGASAVSCRGVVATADEHSVKLSTLAGEPLDTIEMAEYVRTLAFHPAGDLLAVGFPIGPVRVLDLASKSPLATLKVHHAARHLAFAPDGTLAADLNGTVVLWGSRAIGVGLPPKAAARTDDDDLDTRLATIRTKIAARDLRMNSPASAAEVAEFEREAGIALPAGYRRFLLEVANGGSGPGHLRPLEVAAQDSPEQLDEEFPFVGTWEWEADRSMNPQSIGWSGGGLLSLVDCGCGEFWCLVLAGPARGEMWSTCGDGISPCEPPRDFLSWYEYWLDGGNVSWSQDDT
jgi:hypothetical protein